jgi:hypothetical protein
MRLGGDDGATVLLRAQERLGGNLEQCRHQLAH